MRMTYEAAGVPLMAPPAVMDERPFMPPRRRLGEISAAAVFVALTWKDDGKWP